MTLPNDKRNSSQPPRAMLIFGLLACMPVQAALFGEPSGCGVNMSCPGDPGNTQCVNNNNGSTCGTDSGPASQSSSTGQNVGAGNPLNLLSGNKYQKETDLPALPGVLGLEIVRHYNSLRSGGGAVNGILGRGWRLSYETELYVVRDTVQIVQADGARIIFNRDPRNRNVCASLDPARGKVITSKTARGETYLWVWPNGRQLSFNVQGKLTQIAAPTGEFVALTHDPAGNLVQVTDPQGRSLVLGYHDRRQPDRFHGVASIDSPLGRYTYRYGTQPADPQAADARLAIANLTEVGQPGPGGKPIVRHYHYEDARYPTYLTGISVTGAGSDGQAIDQRVGTYGYDDQGRAVLTVRGAKRTDGKPGLEQVTLDFGQPGKTVLTNSLGQKTLYLTTLIGSERRILEARGPGCAACGDTNVRYRYDKYGRLTASTRLDSAGRPIDTTTTELDAASRPLKETRYRYVDGKARAIDWTRYEYAGAGSDTLPAPQPILIARPSVIAGQEHQIRITWNERGQPLSITESGFAPAVGAAKVSRGGTPPQPVAITRTLTYRYQIINGRSVLAEIDGPLANGPKADPADSDITRNTWDARGSQPIEIVRPGDFRQILTYDPAGRIASSTDDDGHRQLVTTTTYSGIAAIGLGPERVERQAGQLKLTLRQTRYDALGRQTTVIDSAGRASHTTYDAAGRLTGIADASGHQGRRDLDSEGRLERAGLYRPGATDQPYRATYFWRDALGRRTARLLPDGRLDTWAYDEAGQMTQHIDGDEVRTRYLANANLRVRVDQSTDGGLRLNVGQTGGVLGDDFGHLLRQPLPDHGVKTARYDVANRIVQIASADGSRIDYAYDVAGRLVRKTSTDAQGKVETVELGYQGRLLATRSDAAQQSQFRHDALGRKIGETIQLTGLKSALATATRYDATTGLVEARTLADGRVLRIERSDAMHGATAQSLRLQPAWAAAIEDWLTAHISVAVGSTVGGWLPSQAIASDIRVDPFDGLTASTAGNGLRTERSYDIAGRLTRLDIQKVGELNYRYGIGPRLQGVASPLLKADYRYTGFGRLALPPTAGPALIKTALAAPVRDALGRTVEDARYRYAYTAAGAVESVSDKSGQLLARYRYNSLGQRVAKTVNGVTTFTLWQDGNRVAEVDETGNIEAQYLYLTEGQRATPIAKLDAEHSHFIHTDHRGAPIAMTDEQQAIVWRANVSAWGSALPVNAESFGPASLNLRLPGQYYDEETGLHDNWHRTYDPGTGRYLQPDPLGYPDGPDAYLYVGGDPVNRIDPMGLYAEDVHYYMTYFLALLAGIDAKQAWVIATAAQTIDNVNPYTDALPSLAAGGNLDARERYHFTQDGFDPQPGAGDILYTTEYDPSTGTEYQVASYSPEYQLRRLTAWNNTQIQTLHGYAVSAGDQYGACMKGQFYGEYLHALEDVFGHRKPNNDPYGATQGHWYDGTEPDMTYDHGVWQNNEQRTLEMERVVFERLQSDFGREATDKDGFPIQFSDIEEFLSEWNKVPEIGGIKDAPDKVTALEAKLTDLFGKETKIPVYEPNTGLGCRLKYLRDAQLINADGKATSDAASQYPGAILETKTDGATECNPPA